MNSNLNILSTISKLQEVKLDKQTLASWQRNLQDQRTIEIIGKKVKEFIISKRGSWSLSILTASLVSFITIPPLLKSLAETQELIQQYRDELKAMPTVLKEVNKEREKYKTLENSELLFEKYILNSERVLFFPEVIRQAAAPHQIRLVSFRPTADDQDNEFFTDEEISTEEFGDGSFNDEEFYGEGSMEPFNDGVNDMFGEAGNSDLINGQNTRKKELVALDYSLQLEGDYLKILSFLRDIQGYQSLLSIKSTKYSTADSASMDSSMTNTSSTGSVVVDIVIQIPTFRSE